MQDNSKNRTVFNLKKNGINRCLDFGHYHYNAVKPMLKNHIHTNSIEICFYLKGEQHYYIEDELFQLTGNNILIIPPNTAHGSGDYPEDKGEMYWLQISLENTKGKLCHLPFTESNYLLNILLNNTSKVFKSGFLLKPILENLLQKLAQEEHPLKKTYINQLILQLLLETVNLTDRKEQVIASDRLIDIDNYISKNLQKTIYVDELASIAKLSNGYFKAWFKKEKGITPKDYVNRIKIQQAKKDLLEKPFITQVAFDLGYNSSQYFATIFKKFTGLTPRNFINSKQ